MRFGFASLLFIWLGIFPIGCGSCSPARSGAEAVSGEELQAKPAPAHPKVDFVGATYVGSEACAACGHQRIHREWSGGLHNKMFRKVGPGVIEGNFDNQTLEHMGWHFRMYRQDNDYYIQEVNPEGEETIYKVDYTLGSKRIQHYLSVRPNKAIRVAGCRAIYC